MTNAPYLDRRTGEFKFKVWIEAHERGDRSLGIVEHSLAGGLLRGGAREKTKNASDNADRQVSSKDD